MQACFSVSPRYPHRVSMIEQISNTLDKERLQRACSQSPADRFLAGGELFEDACEITKAGIRNAHPGWSEPRVLEELKHRLALPERGRK